jgi:DNA-binding NtrC family response regulator
MNLGADDYLTKPFTISEALEAVHTRLRRHDEVVARAREAVEREAETTLKASTPPRAEPSTGAPRESERPPPRVIDPVARQQILDALEHTAGNQTRAAEILGISRRTLVTRLTEFDIPRPRKR